MERKNIGKEAAEKKIKHFCSYQERCHREVREKLYDMGLYPSQVEELISKLVEENFLNEERFAVAFAGGKFRMNYWGKIKIKRELQMRGVSEYCIRKGLSSIPENDYFFCLQKLYSKRKPAGKPTFAEKIKTRNFLLQKGFESSLIQEVMNESQLSD